jgi:O-acetyl-ADP-ribose deacetylase (regulator of RNase III)
MNEFDVRHLSRYDSCKILDVSIWQMSITWSRMSSCGLYSSIVAEYPLCRHQGFHATLRLVQGSVLEYNPGSQGNSLIIGAIVNAANCTCLGGGGVDGAITAAGGPNLHADQLALQVLHSDEEEDVRCWTGSAVTTGPGSYGSIQVPYIIHAVGPNYRYYTDSYEEADQLLHSAYTCSLVEAQSRRVTHVAFSLLSAGVYRGRRSLEDVLSIGIRALVDFYSATFPPNERPPMEVVFYGYTDVECRKLYRVCESFFRS